MNSIPHDCPEFNGDFWAAKALESGGPADDEEYGHWLAGIFPDRYLDEAPELSDAEMYTPDDDAFEPEPFDREWWAEQLAHLESQRPNCLGLDLTLADLDREIAALRAVLVARGGS